MKFLKNILNRLFSRDLGTISFQFYSLTRFGSLLLASIFLARSLPDQELIARYEFLLLLGGSASFFWVSGLYDAFVVAFKQSATEEQNIFNLTTLRLASLFAIGSGLTVYLLGAFAFPHRVHHDELIAYSSFLGLDTLAMALIYMLMVHRKASLLFIISGFSALLYLGMIALVTDESGLTLSFGILACIALLKVLLIPFIVPHKYTSQVKTPGRKLFQLAWPLSLAALLSHSATYLDGFLVEHFFADQFTNFRYGARELPLILLLANSLSVVRSGDIAEGVTQNELQGPLKALMSSGQRLILWLVPLSLILLFGSDYLFEEVFGTDFLGAVPIFDIYLLLVIPRLIFPQSVLRGHQRMKIMTWSAAAELVLNVALSLIGMHYFGLVGIAGATVIAYFVEKVILVVYCHRVLGIQLNAYTSLSTWSVASLVMLGAWIMKYMIQGG